MKANSNARQIAAKYRQRINRLNAALKRGLNRGARAVDAEQVKNLSGSGPAGSYPVPVRKGTLRGGHGWAVQSHRRGAVFNTTTYAMAIHRDRPFLDDAAKAVDVTAMVADEVRRGFAV